MQIFRSFWKKCVGQFESIGHSLKNLGPSQKTLRHPWITHAGYGPGGLY